MNRDSLLSNKEMVFEVQTTRTSTKEISLSALKIADKSGVILVSTPTVYKLYGQPIEKRLKAETNYLKTIVLDLDECRKTMDTVLELVRESNAAGIDRRGTLVALGGGVLADVVTFAASMIRRGISYVCIPTTLMGQVDAGIGLKGGVNFGDAKNYLGCFHPPKAVLNNPNVLKTLPHAAICQGLVEIVKMALIRDNDLFELLENHAAELVHSCFGAPDRQGDEIICRAISGMLRELETNPYEDQTLERFVDLGHTISPVLEARSKYELHHGFAVSIDIAFSACLSEVKGLLTSDDAKRILNLLAAVGAPLWSDLLSVDLVETGFTASAKHRGNALNLPVPIAICECDFIRGLNDVTRVEIERSLSLLSYRQTRIEGESVVCA